MPLIKHCLSLLLRAFIRFKLSAFTKGVHICRANKCKAKHRIAHSAQAARAAVDTSIATVAQASKDLHASLKVRIHRVMEALTFLACSWRAGPLD